MRPHVAAQVVREYTYVYGAFCPADGGMDSFIFPDMYTDTMSVFLRELGARHESEYLLVVTDGAPCHRSETLIIPDNISLLRLPPYSPECNPSENMWDEIREKWFHNCVFVSMSAVVSRLVTALQYLESHPNTVQSITGWPWIIRSISNGN